MRLKRQLSITAISLGIKNEIKEFFFEIQPYKLLLDYYGDVLKFGNFDCCRLEDLIVFEVGKKSIFIALL